MKKEVITKDVITFTANDDEYEAEPGMTWEERIGSSYDTSGGLFEINEDNYDFPVVMFRKVDLHIGIGGPLIKPNEEIISENYFGW